MHLDLNFHQMFHLCTWCFHWNPHPITPQFASENIHVKKTYMCIHSYVIVHVSAYLRTHTAIYDLHMYSIHIHGNKMKIYAIIHHGSNITWRHHTVITYCTLWWHCLKYNKLNSLQNIKSIALLNLLCQGADMLT